MTDGLNIAEWVHMLRHPNNREAYRALQSLQEASNLDNAVYAYIDTFIEMMRELQFLYSSSRADPDRLQCEMGRGGKDRWNHRRVFRARNRQQAHHCPTVHKIPPETC